MTRTKECQEMIDRCMLDTRNLFISLTPSGVDTSKFPVDIFTNTYLERISDAESKLLYDMPSDMPPQTLEMIYVSIICGVTANLLRDLGLKNPILNQ